MSSDVGLGPMSSDIGLDPISFDIGLDTMSSDIGDFGRSLLHVKIFPTASPFFLLLDAHPWLRHSSFLPSPYCATFKHVPRAIKGEHRRAKKVVGKAANQSVVIHLLASTIHPDPLTGLSRELKNIYHWEVLNGVGVDGVGGISPFFSFFFFFFFFFVFLRFFVFFFRFSSFFFSFFFAILRFSSFIAYSPGTRANDCNLLGKWGISLRPRLHRPRSELPDTTTTQTARE